MLSWRGLNVYRGHQDVVHVPPGDGSCPGRGWSGLQSGRASCRVATGFHQGLQDAWERGSRDGREVSKMPPQLPADFEPQKVTAPCEARQALSPFPQPRGSCPPLGSGCPHLLAVTLPRSWKSLPVFDAAFIGSGFPGKGENAAHRLCTSPEP